MKESIRCPNCNTELARVQTENPSLGLKLSLDQCPTCGGIWLDKYELFQVPETEACRLDERKLTMPAHINATTVCPIDHSMLVRLTDPYIPQDVAIDKCDKCGGVWLNCGELADYKRAVKHRKSKIDSLASAGPTIPAAKTEDSLSKIARFLMSPLGSPTDTTNTADKWRNISPNQMEFIKSLPEEKRARFFELFAGMPVDDDNGRETANTVMAVLDIVLRILFRVIAR